jgi:2-dehydropantoate 2-reductase
MKINIIGPGSMGVVISFFLSRKNDVSLIVKKEDIAVYRRGLVMIENGQRHEFSVDISDAPPESDLTVMAVKSYDLGKTIRDYKPKGNVMFIQNGLDHLDIKGKGMRKIYAVTTWGARRLSRGVVELTGRGYFRVGSNDVKLDLTFLREVGIDAEWSDDIVREIYRKAAINAVINPITSIFEVRNGELMKSGELYSIASETISELETLFSKMGYDLEIENNVRETCNVTGNNVSSMLQDIKQGRMTEIDSITGNILKLGKKHGVRLPVNEALYNSIIYLQKRGMSSGKTTSPI